MAVFESKKSSTDIKINETMSDDEVVASDLMYPRGSCFTGSASFCPFAVFIISVLKRAKNIQMSECELHLALFS